jgi:hypothetical protein
MVLTDTLASELAARAAETVALPPDCRGNAENSVIGEVL